MVNNIALEWKSKLCFLGSTFVSSKSVKCNLQSVRQKYFRSLNGLSGKIGAHFSVAVTVSLINFFCLPILLYGIEAFNVTNSMYNSLESAYSAAFSKIFGTYDKHVIKQCQYYCGVLPVADANDIKRLNFLKGMSTVKNASINFLLLLLEKYELSRLLAKHNVLLNAPYSWKFCIRNNFTSTLDILS